MLQRLFRRFCSNTEQDVSFECKVFEDAMQRFKRDFQDEITPKRDLFQLPECLKSSVHVYLFHQVTKPIHFRNVPENTLYVDVIGDPDTEIAFINRQIKEDTNGFLQGLDPSTETELYDPEFRYLLLGLFYIKASWDGQEIPSLPFYNRNGQIKTNVPFFKLTHQKAFVRNQRIHVRIDYDPEGYIVFSKPCRHWNKQFDNVTAILPKLNLEGRKEAVPTDHLGKIVINFKYKQDEFGFEAACMYAEDAIDGPEKPVKHVIFNVPFKIEIYCKDVLVFRVDVRNMS